MGLIQNIRDFKNFLQFNKDVNSEMKRANSKMTRFNIKKNWLGNILYVQINCTDADLMNNDYDYDRMLLMRMKPIVDYLSQELGWGEYLVPQINNFVDDEGNPSLSYGVLFIFTGYSLTITKFLIYSILNLGILSAGIWALFHYVL
ncbi:MAG: hypothetical protein KIH03_05455 [Paludibacteraceae bacterium]|nr:hypothetical protein [Paludibacteraceae bacterium]